MRAAAELFAYAEELFRGVVEELASYGVHADEGLALRHGHGLFCHYDLEARQVFLSVPDVEEPSGKFQAIVIREMLACPSDEELYAFMRRLLPRFIAHELAHHYRHRYGRFGANLWHEEHVANHLATALTKRRMSPAERRHTISLVRRVIDALGGGTEGLGEETYHSAVHALRVEGRLEPTTFEMLLTMSRAFQVDPERLLRHSALARGDIDAALERREEGVATFNREYAQDWRRYFHMHLSWMVLDLESPQSHYVEEFARDDLGITRPTLLAPRRPPHERLERAAAAAFRGHLALEAREPTASRYFYRRYRAHLLDRLRDAAGESSLVVSASDASALFESWAPGEPEPFEVARNLLPAALHGLLPDGLHGANAPAGVPPDDFLETADVRLWEHATGIRPDEQAAATLDELALLERVDLFRALPVDTLVELSARLIRQKYVGGEPIIWAGDRETDVYVLVAGSAEVIAAESEQIVGTIAAGQTSGEMACLTLEPRVSSVRAREPCEVRILKSSELRLLGARHPVIYAELGRALARRLARATTGAAAELPNREKGRSTMADVQSLAKRAATDADFMRKLVSDPERTLRAEGISLTPEMLKAIKALDAEEMERAVRAFADSKPGAAM